MSDILIDFQEANNLGVMSRTSGTEDSGWRRIMSASLNIDANCGAVPGEIRLHWHNLLSVFGEFRLLQRQLGFRFISTTTSRPKLQEFLAELRAAEEAASGAAALITSEEARTALIEKGFSERELREFQLRDLAILASLPNGANFSVPGAGKTTVTLAVHLLWADRVDRLLVVCPKSAFPAWTSILGECLAPGTPYYSDGVFINLSGMSVQQLRQMFATSHRFFVTNYEHFVSMQEAFASFLITGRVHLVLDESHRMKAGQASLRGAALLSVATLPRRRDILSGTPMPHSPGDLQSQLDFLWPGSRLGLRIQRGESPNQVIQGLYARTTKNELGLPPRQHFRVQVPMHPAQGALYGIVRNDVLQQLSTFRQGGPFDVARARSQVTRLLQLSSNPVLALRGIGDELHLGGNPIIEAVLAEGMSPKLRRAADMARTLARNGRKTVIWTIFVQSIRDLEAELAELNPVSIYGAVPSGRADDPATREGRLSRFHADESCMVMIANPAAAGEGISLHEVCHEAIYVDRNYIATQYLQSIDRIHRLGLSPDTITNVHILQSAPPQGLGSIDFSVSRRLGEKIRGLQLLLDDEDLHQVALDEETSDDPIDYAVEFDDIIDLIDELEGRIAYAEDVEE